MGRAYKIRETKRWLKKIEDVKDRGMGQKRGEETWGRVLGEIRNVGWGKKERGSTKAHCFEMPE